MIKVEDVIQEFEEEFEVQRASDLKSVLHRVEAIKLKHQVALRDAEKHFDKIAKDVDKLKKEAIDQYNEYGYIDYNSYWYKLNEIEYPRVEKNKISGGPIPGIIATGKY